MIMPVISLGFLLILSILDVKTFNIKNAGIPSLLSTAFLITSFIFSNNPVYYGVFAALISLSFMDLEVFKGMADVKVFVALCMSFNSLMSVLTFSLMLSAFTIITQVGVKQGLKLSKFKGRVKEIPLIPVITIAYIIYLGVF